jgi:hypothetical protein
MVRGVSAAARERAREQDSNAGLHAWLETGANQRDSVAFFPYAAGGDPTLPPVVSRLDAAEIGSRIASWRAASAPLDALFLQGIPPAAALRCAGSA